MKKIALLSVLSLACATASHAFDQGLLPNEISSAMSGNFGQTSNMAPLTNQSVVELSPSSSMKYPTQNQMFGSQLFKGAFASTAGSTFNSSYQINPGDNINLRLWGAYQFNGTQSVDPQGNIFIPNVGPVKVAGVRNGSLQSVVEAQVRRIYVSNVGVYAALEQAQPVKVMVTGFVNQPGNYGGVANDSVIAYLDRAGGVDPERGSYIDIKVMRNGQTIQQVDLYDFLLQGQIRPFSFRDGDVIVVGQRTHTFNVSGEVYNQHDFEFNSPAVSLAQALAFAKLKPGATNVSIQRRQGSEYRSEYHSLNDAYNVMVEDGDVVTVTADRYAGTIQVRVDGAHNGTHAMVLPYGAKLSDVLTQLQPNILAEVEALQLFRPSVAKRQKEMINVALNKLEEATFNARSSTQEEAALRLRDAELVKQFIEKARKIEPKGQVVLNPNTFQDVILEQGDVLYIPQRTSVVMVHGEVAFPNGVEYKKGLDAKDYIDQVGGFSQRSNKSKIIVIRQNGKAELVRKGATIQQGDEILVLPKAQTKGVELTRGITQVLYQIAVAAKVALDL
ncbi:polysaccharide biosynthesis/export family protein [Acinetobacter lwoffii]|uniref:Polysaccharide biosynthesis/export family protein n=1 Tax=Acinetobacter lwoffii TaxID=28090 RepID=A0AAW8ATZ0_ACILW|nr:polysaccharide biosynthesis/export family protein [Acinetobacter lwoffii]MDP1370049.1 polysaccharide biosynthesis/export family protein [Acinetobacter lwoffii]MDP1389500.1 polysaccharide biosynthesis/export family protein [Acinetobacter lwoffii]MDP1447137.1 polysaccharide biosynthesis/export family protein [Acinetobacter lwoffii]